MGSPEEPGERPEGAACAGMSVAWVKGRANEANTVRLAAEIVTFFRCFDISMFSVSSVPSTHAWSKKDAAAVTPTYAPLFVRRGVG